MVKTRVNKIIFSLLILFSAMAYGAEVDNALLQKNLEAANLQIEVLKAQVEVMKSYQDKFLSTVYWSLGTVAALVVFLAGINWFTNNRNLEKEAQLQKETIQNELISIRNKLNEKVDEALLESKAASNETIKLLENDLKTSILEKSENLGKSINAALINNLRPIIRDLRELKRRSIESDYEDYLNRKIYENAIRKTCELLDLTINDYDFQSNTSNALTKIETTLKLAQQDRRLSGLSPETIAMLVNSLKPFEEKHNIVIKRIHQQLSEIE